MSTDRRHGTSGNDDGRAEERFTRAARSVADSASSLTPFTAHDARRREQRRNARTLGVVALIACFGLVAAVTAGRRADTRDLAVGTGPAGAGTTLGSTPGSTPISTIGSAPGTTSVTVAFDTTATTGIDGSPTTIGPTSTNPRRETDPDATIPTEPSTTLPGDDPTVPKELVWTIRTEGTYAGVGHYQLFTNACRDMKHDLELLFVHSTGTVWTLNSTFCASIDSNNVWSGEGPFTLFLPEGSTLTGILTSEATLPTGGVPYGLKITGGTGRWVGAQGWCRLTINLRETTIGEQPQDGTFQCEAGVPGPRPPAPLGAPGTEDPGR